VYRESTTDHHARMLCKVDGLNEIESFQAYGDDTIVKKQPIELTNWRSCAGTATLPLDNWYIVHAPRFKKGEIVYNVKTEKVYFYLDDWDDKFSNVTQAQGGDLWRTPSKDLISAAEYNERYLKEGGEG